MPKRNLRDVTGTIGSTSVRLASWLQGSDTPPYSRRYIPVKPQDRFVPGQQFEFTADLEFRDWVIDDFSGGIQPGPWWNPTVAGVRELRGFFPDGGALRISANREETTENPSTAYSADYVFAAEGLLWSADANDGLVRQWDGSEWSSSTVTTGTSTDIVTSYAAPGGGLLYVATEAKDIHEVSDLTGTPSNAVHYATGASDPFSEDPLIVAFDGRVFALDGNDLYEIDTSTTDTRTQVSDVTEPFIADPVQDYYQNARLSVSDVGPIWWVFASDGYTYVKQYNVASDTTETLGRLPLRGVRPGSIAWAYGFTFVSFIDAPIQVSTAEGRGFVFYKRGGQEGTLGPLPGANGHYVEETWDGNTAPPYRFDANEMPHIVGALGSRLLVLTPNQLLSYDFDIAAWGTLGMMTTAGVASLVRASSIVVGRDIFVGDGGTGSRVYRFRTDRAELTASLVRFTTGRWHFGYPNVEKIFTEVSIDANALDANDDIDLYYSVDGAATFTQATGTFSGTGSTYTWTLSDNSTTVSGHDIELSFRMSGRSSSASDLVKIHQIRARATTAQSRREWQLILDASDSGGAGHEQNDVEWLQALETLKTSKAVVEFTDPWQQRDDGSDTFDVIVEDVITPAATHSADDQRTAIVVLREVGLV